MKKIVLLLLFVISSNCFSQKADFDIYILCKSKTSLKNFSIKTDSAKYEIYNIFWPSSLDNKKLGLKINDQGKLVKSVKLLGGNSRAISLKYSDIRKQNPSKKIQSEDLFKNSTNLIRLEDFIYYDYNELINAITKSKNLYILFEDEKKGKYYVTIKVDINSVGGQL